MIASPSGEFESGWSKEGQTREHALLSFTMGVKQMIVCCNKMDAKGADYKQDRYDEIKTEVSLYLKQVGNKMDAKGADYKQDRYDEIKTDVSLYLKQVGYKI